MVKRARGVRGFSTQDVAHGGDAKARRVAPTNARAARRVSGRLEARRVRREARSKAKLAAKLAKEEKGGVAGASASRTSREHSGTEEAKLSTAPQSAAARDAAIKARGDEKIREVNAEAEKLINDILKRVEARVQAIEKTQQNEASPEALQKSLESIRSLNAQADERIKLIEERTANRVKLIEGVVSDHLSSRRVAALAQDERPDEDGEVDPEAQDLTNVKDDDGDGLPDSAEGDADGDGTPDFAEDPDAPEIINVVPDGSVSAAPSNNGPPADQSVTPSSEDDSPSSTTETSEELVLPSIQTQQQYPQADSTTQQQLPQADSTTQQQYPQADSTMQQQYPQADSATQQQYPQADSATQSQYPGAQQYPASQTVADEITQGEIEAASTLDDVKKVAIEHDSQIEKLQALVEDQSTEHESIKQLIASIDEKIDKLEEGNADFRNKMEEQIGSLAKRVDKVEKEGVSDEEDESDNDEDESRYPSATPSTQVDAVINNVDSLLKNLSTMESRAADAEAEVSRLQSQLDERYFDESFYRMRPVGLEPDFQPAKPDPAQESGAFFACNVPKQCMNGMTMYTRNNRLIGLKGLCDGGARSTDLTTGFYERFPKMSSIDFDMFGDVGADKACTMSFGEHARSLWIRRESDFVIAMSKDGTKATRCGRDVEAATSIRYQCQNPKACITGFHVKNEYGNFDGNEGKRTEDDLAISVVDFVCSDGNFAVDPITLRPDYGQVKVEPTFTVGVANTPQHDGSMRRTVTPYLRLKTNTVVSDSFLMIVKVRDITDSTDHAGWCTQQNVQASLNAPHTCREGSKLCAKPAFLYNPEGMEYELKFGEQTFDLLDPELHESSRMVITNEDDSLEGHVKNFPMPRDREFFQFDREYEVCVAAIERSKFKNHGKNEVVDETHHASGRSFYNRHLDGSATFMGLSTSGERQLQMQGGPKHFMVRSPKAPKRSEMTALQCYSGECSIAGSVGPIEDEVAKPAHPADTPTYPAQQPADKPAYPTAELAKEHAENNMLDARAKLEAMLREQLSS